MRKTYSKPMAEKFVFDYAENVTASCWDPVHPHHGDVGHGLGHGGGCDHIPGHDTPKKPHP